MTLFGATSTFTVGATTVTFKALLRGAALDRKSSVSVRHIPGGNVNYYDDGGLEAPTFKVDALFDTYADMLIVQSLMGPDASFSNGEDTYAVKLTATHQTQVTGRGGQRFVTLDFAVIV